MKMKRLAVAGMATVLASGLVIPAAPSLAQDSDGEKTQFTRSEIEGIVRDYLLQNPEIMYDVQAALEEKQRQAMQEATQKVISQASDQLFNAEHDGVIGNPDGDVTVVEFFDYNCGYCRRALADMDALLEQDPELRFVLKEFPVLGPDSQRAHIVSMAFRALAPEKYADFHRRLLGSSGRANEESAIAIALELGVDEEALRNEMQRPEAQQQLEKNMRLAQQLQITGTPSYVIGNEVVAGAQGQEILSDKIAELRD